jgi:hypothetical protein
MSQILFGELFWAICELVSMASVRQLPVFLVADEETYQTTGHR